MEDSIARALRIRLRDEAHPYKRRLKLCQKLSQVKEISKSENINGVLLEWITASISSDVKIISEETALRQWKMFHKLLQLVLQHDTDLTVIRRYLPSKFFHMLTQWLSNFQSISEDIQIEIASCCKIAVQSKNLLETLLLNFKDFASIVSAIITALAQATNTNSIISDFQLILSVMLEKSHIVKLLQVDREEVFRICVQQLLKPVAQLLTRNHQNVDDKTLALIKSALGSCLFSKSLERHFKQMLNGLLQESFPDDCPQFLKSFLTVLQEEFEDAMLISNKVAACFPIVLDEFLAQYKNLHCHEKFHFVVLLVRLLGIEATDPEKDYIKNKRFFTASFSENDAGFSILADLLSLVGKHPDILNVAGTLIIKPTDWLQDMMTFLLMKTQKRSKAWFLCLQAMLEIDNKFITSNFQHICDVAWLSLDQLDPDVQQAQSSFFCQVLTTFAKLQQSKGFVDKIITALSLNIVPGHFKQFHLPCSVLEKFDTVCATLPSGQVLQLWKSFNNYVINYYIPKMAESPGDVRVIRNCVHPVLQLMSSFLLNVQFVEHVTNISNMAKEIITKSVNTSKSCITPLLLESLKAEDAVLFRNTLNLAHSWGEAHLMLMNYNPIYAQLWKTEINHHVSPPGSSDDLTFVHEMNEGDFRHLISKVCADTEEPALQFMFAQLVAQKIRALLAIKEEISGITRQSITTSAGYFINLLKSCEATTVWDKKISSIDETNLPVALWSIFCESLPVLVPYLSEDNVMTVARIMVSTFDKDTGGVFNQSEVTRSFARSDQINESILIQSALTVAAFEGIASVMLAKERKLKNGKVLWEKVCKVLHMTDSAPEMWLQYANSTPAPTASGLNPLWSMIKEAADNLSNAFRLSVSEEDLRFLPKHLPLNLLLQRLMFLSEFPLEYFVPGNQIHCLFGILALLIPIMHSKHCDTVLVECIIQCLKTVFALVDSMRSNWLLDLIQAQDLLLWIFGPFTNFQIRVCTEDSISSKLRNEFRESSRQFLEVILNLVRGNSNIFNGFDTFLSQVEMLPAWQQLNDCSRNVPTLSYAVIMMRLFQKMQRSSNKGLMATCQKYISRISKSLIHWFLAMIKTQHDISKSEKQSMIAPFLEGFNIILEFQMNTDKEVLNQQSQNFKHWKKLIPEVKSVITGISTFSKDFTSVESSCQIMCNFCKHRDALSKYISNDIFQETWKVVDFYLKSSLIQNQQSENPNDQHLKQRHGFVEQLINISSNTEFDWLLKTILNDFNVQDIQNYNVDQVKLVLHLWQVFASTSLNCDRKIILEKHSKDFIMLCQHALYQIAKQRQEHSWEIAACIIEVQACLTKKINVTANCVTLCLQGCTFVDLLKIHDSSVYGKCFEAICLLLNNMLLSRTKIINDMMPSFLAAVQDAMKSVIQKGQQQFLKDAPEDDVKIICGCAHTIERLLSQIAVSSLDFTKVAPYIIASFVTESCNGTLYPAVKNYLTDGIYPVMQLCDDHAVAALQASLNDTARQVFNFLLETYMHYYQYKGKV